MIVEIPLSKSASQSMQITLNGQNCSLFLTQRDGRMYCALSVSNVSIWKSVLCHDRTPIRQFRVQKFVGNLVFVDRDGSSDPVHTGFGERYRLYYITDDVILDEAFQRRGTGD